MDNIYDNNEYSKAMKAILMEIGEDTVKDYGEMALDAFLDDNMLKNIPVIGTLINLGKCGMTIKNLQFAKNYYVFIQEIRNKEISKEKLDKHIEELKNNPKRMRKEMETLLIYLEQYKEIEKIKYMANIYYAFLRSGLKGIKWDQALIFFEILDRLLLCDIEDLKKIKRKGAKPGVFNDHSGLLRLSALGLLQYFNGKEEKYGHNKSGIANVTSQGEIFYRVITSGKCC